MNSGIIQLAAVVDEVSGRIMSASPSASSLDHEQPARSSFVTGGAVSGARSFSVVASPIQDKTGYHQLPHEQNLIRATATLVSTQAEIVDPLRGDFVLIGDHEFVLSKKCCCMNLSKLLAKLFSEAQYSH